MKVGMRVAVHLRTHVLAATVTKLLPQHYVLVDVDEWRRPGKAFPSGLASYTASWLEPLTPETKLTPWPAREEESSAAVS